jgi:membrane-bound metal-dependent hydrolase YbcI (DUF457 family)
MPQAGIHAITGLASRTWMPKKEWLLLGVLLGNMFPDLDNLAVAYATLTRADPHGLHRTFTHSLFTTAALLILFHLMAAVTKDAKWSHFGAGFAAGILMHILLDLVAWFDGVELFWPISYELNFWRGFVKPDWVQIFLDTGEFLAFGLYFVLLLSLVRRNRINMERQTILRAWAYMQFALFILFTVLFLFAPAIPLLHTIYGALYLGSLIAAIVLTVNVREMVESM